MKTSLGGKICAEVKTLEEVSHKPAYYELDGELKGENKFPCSYSVDCKNVFGEKFKGFWYIVVNPKLQRIWLETRSSHIWWLPDFSEESRIAHLDWLDSIGKDYYENPLSKKLSRKDLSKPVVRTKLLSEDFFWAWFDYEIIKSASSKVQKYAIVKCHYQQ